MDRFAELSLWAMPVAAREARQSGTAATFASTRRAALTELVALFAVLARIK